MGAFMSEPDNPNTNKEPILTEKQISYTESINESHTEEIKTKPKISANPKTNLILYELDLLIENNPNQNYVKRIHELKAAVNSIRINSIELAAKLGVLTNKVLLTIDNTDNPQAYRVCMRELLEVKLDEAIIRILDYRLEDNHNTRDLFNFYAKMLKSMQTWFHLVEGEYDKNLPLTISIRVMTSHLKKLNSTIGNIVNSVY